MSFSNMKSEGFDHLDLILRAAEQVHAAAESARFAGRGGVEPPAWATEETPAWHAQDGSASFTPQLLRVPLGGVG